MLKIVLLFTLLILPAFSLTVNHPISLTLLLMLMCLFISIFILKMSYSWLFYLLVLMFLGGVMIIITYMTSLAANEKAFKQGGMKFLPVTIIPLWLFFFDDASASKLLSSASLAKSLFEGEFSGILIFCFLMLFLALISVVKLLKIEEGPLVKRLLKSNLMKMYICQM